MDCEQNGHSHGLPSVKLQQPGPGQSKRSLQATLSQSFQPDTPEHPQDSLLHSVSATSMRSTGSGIDPQTMNTQDASQPEESAFAMSAQRASTKQQLHQQSNPSAANGGANMLDDMLPEHSLAAQMSSEALASSLQQLSQPAANTQVEELADDMMPEHSLAAQMSNADQVLPLEEKAATDMLPEHSLVAQMSIDEPQPDAGEEDSVASGTRQLPHVLTTIESGNAYADHRETCFVISFKAHLHATVLSFMPHLCILASELHCICTWKCCEACRANHNICMP